MNKVIAGAVLAVGVGIGGLAVAAPATAAPMDFQCAPCVADVNGDGKTDPIWNEVTSLGPWETIMDATNGNPTDGKGAWESGVEAVNGGAWEKAFPPPAA